MHRNRISGTWLLAGMLLLAGCASAKLHWPFARVASVAKPVSELELKLPASGPAPVVLQYWERNTLVLDLQNVPAKGEVGLLRRAGSDWPARIAVRMSPQRFEVLEVRGAQRLLLPVSSAGTDAVTAELSSSLYDPSTSELAVSWGSKDSF